MVFADGMRGGHNNYRGMPQRGGHPGGQRGGGGGGGTSAGRGRGNSRQTPLKFEGDFDFEGSNAKFDKEEIEKELKKLTIGKISS